VCAALVVGAGLLAAGPRASAAGETTFTTALDTQVSTFNPFIAYFDGELTTLGNIYPTLTRLDDKLAPEPYLATSWTTSDDKLTWTFKIKDGLKWSDGQPLTAKDAAWTLNLIMTNTTAAQANGSLVANFKSVTAPDDTTLVITTKQPQANMLYVSVPFNGIPIVPQHIWESKVSNLKNVKNTDYPVVGYGPWVLTGYQTDQYVTLKANKDFFLGAPKYDQLILQYFKNTDASVAALRAGQVNQVGGVTSTQFAALKNDPNIMTYQTVGNSWTAVEINSGAKTRTGKPIGTGNPILADTQVRLAILYAIDKAALVKNVLGGLGVAGAGYLPPAYPQFFWTPPADQQINFDAAKANQILDEAGYTKGSDGVRVDPKTKKPLNFRLGIHSDDTQDAQIAGYPQGLAGRRRHHHLHTGDEHDQAQRRPGQGRLGHADGRLGHRAGSHVPAGHPDLRDASARRRDRRQHRRVLLQPGLRQAVRPAGHRVRRHQAGRHHQADAGDPVPGERGHDPVLQERAVGDPHRQDDQLRHRNRGRQGLLPVCRTVSRASSTPPPSYRSPPPSHTGLYVLTGVVVLLILAGAVLLLVRRRSTAGERE